MEVLLHGGALITGWPNVSAALTYRPTPQGIWMAVMFLLFHKQLCGPLAHSLFAAAPSKMSKARTKIQAAYGQADTSVQRLVDLPGAA